MNLAEVEFEGNFRFSHQQWQEFFAARFLATDYKNDHKSSIADNLYKIDFTPPPMPDIDTTLETLSSSDLMPNVPSSRWTETAKLLMQICGDQWRNEWFNKLVEENPVLAATAAEPCIDKIPSDRVTSLHNILTKVMNSGSTDVRSRVEAANALFQVNDFRYVNYKGSCGNDYRLPTDELLIPINGGEYSIGSLDVSEDEQVAGATLPIVNITNYLIAFAPVTNAEFRYFVNSGGYEDMRWWTSEESRNWLSGEFELQGSDASYYRDFWGMAQTDPEGSILKYKPDATNNWIEKQFLILKEMSKDELESWIREFFGGGKKIKPELWNDPLFNSPSQPVVGVSWYEAKAYAAWLSSVSGLEFKLPTEAQWEVAAQDNPPQPWPWGKEPPNKFQINSGEAHIRRTTPVGAFPDGSSKSGLVDIAGNVWEWCQDWYAYYERQTIENYNGPPTGEHKILRGGSWAFNSHDCRTACRGKNPPSYRDYNIGFRLVLS